MDIKEIKRYTLLIALVIAVIGILLGLLDSSLVFPKEAKTIITEDWISDAITHYVEEQIPWAEDHVRVDLVGSTEKVFVSDEKVEYSVSLPDNRGPLGRRAFRIDFKQDGANYRTLKVTADVRVEMDVVAISHPLKKYEIIKEDDLYTKKIAFYDLSGNLVFDPKAVVGKRTKRFVKPGTPITEEMIEEAPVVKKGERVIIIVEARGLMITAVGEARMDGARGKMIEVINSDSKKRIYAEVLDPGRVRVNY